MSAPTPRPHPSRLPQSLAIFYGLMIVYASLEPFSGWQLPPPGTPFFLWAAAPFRFTRFDLLINVVAYLPFGFFVALIGIRRGDHAHVLRATGCAVVLSVALESLQMLLPTRDASL